METEDLKTICRQHGINPEIVVEKIKKLKNVNKVVIPFWGVDVIDCGVLAIDYVVMDDLEGSIAESLPAKRYTVVSV